MNELQTFALAFAVIWGGLAAYIVWIHRATRDLEKRLARLESERR